ncbi:sugar porter family MFS transporter [Streptomyces ferralitis]|uniref:Sugar porter family MFS transporter n=1 Tax=Streptantibioticus ferralitis TaxID=236510 RepID=A0ABT5YW43_9ACTN|nr:sugar porter family MFS transporter [Streptantibioticus ferralitis]MDF2255703.1 sugar porter family MFS transporter [Streptantibioticus ferralitis]
MPPTRPPHVSAYRTGRMIALTGALVGVIYGYDTGSVSGALVFLSKDFQLSSAEQGLVNSVLVVGSVLGAVLGGRVADALGRRKTMVMVAASYAVFVALSAFAPNVTVLDTMRFLLGVAIGLCIVAAPLYIAESTPARIRGAATATYQVACVAGITITYFVNWGLADGGHWRWMLGLSAVPAALIVIPLLLLPDTPRWYVLKGRDEEAVRVLRLVDPDVDAEAETRAIAAQIRQERGGHGGLAAMFRPPYTRATLFVLALGFFCQITGINAVTYYSPEIFQKMGFTGSGQSFLLPSIVELASLAATVLALFIIDRFGRRVVLFSGIGTMLGSLVVLTAVFGLTSLRGAATWIGFAALLLFTAAFNFGFGSLIWVYASEAFPSRLRSMGASAMLTADLVANFLIAQFFPSVIDRAGPTWTFAGFAVLALLAIVFVARMAPETKGRRLEEIQSYWQNGGRWVSAPRPTAAPAAAVGAARRGDG